MRLLIVEDELKIATALKKGLIHEGYAVDSVQTGNEGFDLASTESYDALVLDVMLPGMNGLEITKKLREAKNFVPILLLTAKGQIDDRVEGLNIGADDYLVKPFGFDELVARIKAITRRNENRDVVLQFADIVLNTITHQVIVNGRSLLLSKKEFSLLEYLMRRKNTIVTKDQILQNVWDYDAEVMPNSVEVYIRHLRTKIDTEGRAPLIQTIRGFGYSLREG